MTNATGMDATEPGELVAQLQTSLQRSNLVTAQMAQFAELLVPAMIDFRQTLAQIAAPPAAPEPVPADPEVGGDAVLERLDRLEALVTARLDEIEARRVAEQPAGFIGRLEDRLRRIEGALGVIAGAAAEIQPVRKAVMTLDQRLAALEARTVSADQAAGLGTAMAAIEEVASSLRDSLAAATAIAPALAALPAQIDKAARSASTGEQLVHRLAATTEKLAAAAPNLLVGSEALDRATGLAEGLDGVAKDLRSSGESLRAGVEAAISLSHAVDRSGQLVTAMEALSESLEKSSLAAQAAAPALSALPQETERARRLFTAIDTMFAKLSAAAELIASAAPGLTGVSTEIATAAKGLAKQAEPLIAASERLSEASAGLAQLPDPTALARSVGVSAATHIAAQLGSWAQTLEARIDAAAAAGDAHRGAIAGLLGEIRSTIGQLTLQIEAMPAIVAEMRPDLSPLTSRLEAMTSSGQETRVGTEMVLAAIQAALGQLTARIDAVSGLVGVAKPDLSPILARLEILANGSAEGRAEAGATLASLSGLLEQLATKVDGAVSKIGEARKAMLDGSREEGLARKVSATVEESFAAALERLQLNLTAQIAAAEAAGPGPAGLLSQAASLEIAEAIVRLERRIEEAIGAPGERIATAVRSLQELGERMRTLDARGTSAAPVSSGAVTGPTHERLNEAVTTINDLGQRFASALRRLERKLAASSKTDDDAAQRDIVAAAAQMRENTAEFLAIGSALSMELGRLTAATQSPATITTAAEPAKAAPSPKGSAPRDARA
ncbi:MAG: hypothetical protein ACK50Q_18545 [Labrys sp. (in: a-proteobacteria)]